jgi:4'-phosphopantetheinyl transferase
MPIIFDHKASASHIRVVHCTEPASNWNERMPPQLLDCDEWRAINHPVRAHEWFNSRVLLYEMDGRRADFRLRKDAFGKPFVENRDYELSLSHSDDFCALLHADKSCGIDIQHFTPKMARITDRFMRPDELAAIAHLTDDDLDKQLHFFWSAKEAIYKAWGTKNLSAQRIHVLNEMRGLVLNQNDVPIKAYSLQSIATDLYECVWAIQL